MEEGCASNPSSLRRRTSFAHCDYMKYKRAFEEIAGESKKTIEGNDVAMVAAKLGYSVSREQLKKILASQNLEETSQISFEQFLDAVPKNTDDIKEDEHKLAELREKFGRYDVNGDGRINLQEAQWALQGELDVSPQTALKLLNQFVQLDYSQFVIFYQQVQKKKLEMFEKFGKYDTDKDGLISVQEAHQVLQDELGLDESKSKAMVERFDINKDGSVSYVEFAEFYLAIEEKKAQIRQTFKRFDSYNNGHVTLDQARHILQDLLGFSEAKCEKAIETYDKNHNGIIDYEEFVEFYAMVEEERQKLLLEFATYDTDGDGRISREELQDMLKEKAYQQAGIDALMSGFDKDHDGYLNFAEFKRFLNFK